MRVLSVDQARHGGWAIYDYDDKSLIDYGYFNFDKIPYEKVMLEVVNFIDTLIKEKDVACVFIEDIQQQANVSVFKTLANLQGALILYLEWKDVLYDRIPPSRWQGFCNARGRTSKELKSNVNVASRGSKELTINFVKRQFGVETSNDNVADAICIGYYVVNNVDIQTV